MQARTLEIQVNRLQEEHTQLEQVTVPRACLGVRPRQRQRQTICIARVIGPKWLTLSCQNTNLEPVVL